MIRDMMNNKELSRAIEKARHFGNMRSMGLELSNPQKRILTPKTGFFTGYWNCGAVAWQGHFENGNQVGMWKYTGVDRESSCTEFYCNL